MVTPYFFDSSALVKRYVAEVGTPWVMTVVAAAGHSVLIARITWVEIISALARRQREGMLPAGQVEQASQALRYDLDMQYQVVELTQDLAENAGQLARTYPLRAYDAVQLAAARRVQTDLMQVHAPPLTFVCADDRLLTIAQAEGLRTVNPLRPPAPA